MTTTDTNPTFIWIVADASGSMSALHETVITGLNDFIAEQAAEEGEAKVTAIQFPRRDGTNGIQTILPMSNVRTARRIDGDDYQIDGNTPLYDAIGAVIEKADNRLAIRAQQGKPTESQVVVIFTDGEENASTRFSRTEVFELIEERKSQGWVFVFLGANLEAFGEGEMVGVAAKNLRMFEASDVGLKSALHLTSRAVSGYRKKSLLNRLESTEVFFDDVDLEDEGSDNS
jgi:Mg-chelatase subunit ChlD